MIDAVASALARIIVCVSAGGLLAQRGILKSEHAALLGSLSKDCFLPALILSEVGKGVTIGILAQWWPIIPASAFIVFCSLSLVRLCWMAVSRVCGLPKEVPSFALAASAFPITTSLPLALLRALPLENLAGSSTGRPLSESESISTTAHSQAASLVLLYTLGMTILRWTVGARLLSPPKHAAIDCVEDESLLATDTQALDPSPTSSINLPACIDLSLTLKAIDTPVRACLLGVFIGIIPTFRSLFYESHLFEPILGSLQWLGAAYVPAVMLILGQELWESFQSPISGQRQSELSVRTVRVATGVALVVRLLLVPAVALAIVVVVLPISTKSDDDTSMARRSLALVFLVESATPPAIALVIMCALNNFQREEMASVMLWGYSLGFATLLVWGSIFMTVASASF